MSDEKKRIREVSYLYKDARDGSPHPFAAMAYPLDEAAGDSFRDGAEFNEDDVIVQKGVRILVRRTWDFRTDRIREKRSIQDILVEKAEQS